MQEPPPGPVDDPTGGRGLTRRLKIVLPVAALAALPLGILIAVLVGDWRPALLIPLGVAALAGTIVAAIEDGRVQRRIDEARRRERGVRPPGPPPPASR